jgi:hypothetical protein
VAVQRLPGSHHPDLRGVEQQQHLAEMTGVAGQPIERHDGHDVHEPSSGIGQQASEGGTITVGARPARVFVDADHLPPLAFR